MDINPDWVNFNQYEVGADGVARSTDRFGATSPNRYLQPDSRDFIVIMIRGAVVPGDSGQVAKLPVHAELALPKKKSA